MSAVMRVYNDWRGAGDRFLSLHRPRALGGTASKNPNSGLSRPLHMPFMGKLVVSYPPCFACLIPACRRLLLIVVRPSSTRNKKLDRYSELTRLRIFCGW